MDVDRENDKKVGLSNEFTLQRLWLDAYGQTGGPLVVAAHSKNGAGLQPLSKTAIHKAVYAFHDNASIKAYVLGAKVIFSSCQQCRLMNICVTLSLEVIEY